MAGATSLLRAQEEVTFTTDVKVVNVLATVRDKRGAIIRDLGIDDFMLLENGRPQTLKYFAKESDLPLTLGLMIDTSMSQEKVLDAERGASLRFLDQVLRDTKDHVFIMQFDLGVFLRQPLTSSRRALDEALSFVDTPSRRELQMQGGGGTLLYHAIVVASNDVMKNQQGRKALIVLSDGVDFGSDETVVDAIEAAQRADTIIHSILFTGVSYGGPSGRGPMIRMAKETGGGFLEVTKKQNIDHMFDVIQEELRSQYNLGYVSDVPVRISEFRKIQLTTKQKGLTVQARDRYWARR